MLFETGSSVAFTGFESTHTIYDELFRTVLGIISLQKPLLPFSPVTKNQINCCPGCRPSVGELSQVGSVRFETVELLMVVIDSIRSVGDKTAKLLNVPRRG
jgi:hypothetical protein